MLPSGFSIVGPVKGVPKNWVPSMLSTLWKSKISEYIMTILNKNY